MLESHLKKLLADASAAGFENVHSKAEVGLVLRPQANKNDEIDKLLV